MTVLNFRSPTKRGWPSTLPISTSEVNQSIRTDAGHSELVSHAYDLTGDRINIIILDINPVSRRQPKPHQGLSRLNREVVVDPCRRNRSRHAGIDMTVTEMEKIGQLLFCRHW